MPWRVDGCPALGEFDTEGAAIAAAWTVTMAGGVRPAVSERALDLSQPETWRPDGIQVEAVKGSMESTAHGPRPVLFTTFRAPRALAELVVHGIEHAEDQRRAYYEWITRNVTPALREQNPFPMHDHEDLSVGIETMFFDGATFVARIEAVIIALPFPKTT